MCDSQIWNTSGSFAEKRRRLLVLSKHIFGMAHDGETTVLKRIHSQIGAQHLDRICRAVNLDLTQEGSSDLALVGRKISGNAQQRKRTHLLHHGSLLYAFDAALVTRYLKMPARRPDYRADREHVDFVTNLPTDAERLRTSLCAVWDVAEPLSAWPI